MTTAKMGKVSGISTLRIICIGLLWIATSAFHIKKSLTRDRAIKLAEKFVIENGYTDRPANRLKVVRELNDILDYTLENVLKRRYKTLQTKAFCIVEKGDSWHVGFLSVSVDLSNLDSLQRQTNLSGRVVIVPKNGKEIHIAHKMPLFSQFEKLY